MSDEQKTAEEWLAEIDAVGCRINTVGGQRLMKMIKRIQNATLERAANAMDRKTDTTAYGHHSMAYENAADLIRALKEPTDTPQEKK